MDGNDLTALKAAAWALIFVAALTGVGVVEKKRGAWPLLCAMASASGLGYAFYTFVLIVS